MARNYSFSVSSATSHFNMPNFVIAYATAVFTLDPKSTASANNMAAAIYTAGKVLSQVKSGANEINSYQKDAESVYLYALSISMDKNAYTDASLVSMINLGNLNIDMNRPDEARSLLQAARKQSPFSWDAAIGMAAISIPLINLTRQGPYWMMKSWTGHRHLWWQKRHQGRLKRQRICPLIPLKSCTKRILRPFPQSLFSLLLTSWHR
jgi:hypothetical protein